MACAPPLAMPTKSWQCQHGDDTAAWVLGVRINCMAAWPHGCMVRRRWLVA
jgi:hypothetical protein